ncbi:uncharacterized protein N0V89_001341 [Didymosphaeria variabile]|uniref:Uncharacterized protein n=1 Tax=Didymosphaeria variabile TaxID=1932322 RepID=A0A9W8XW31_9PLEO|nr:uncharacterized protein N0V89_001341 [Didymosphaeria variabile]KAJ4360774.1 hypothetical protein N0V89_001341 [Didymosphaeria variabile]
MSSVPRSSEAPQTQRLPFRLLDLPRDIRLNIYDELFQATARYLLQSNTRKSRAKNSSFDSIWCLDYDFETHGGLLCASKFFSQEVDAHLRVWRRTLAFVLYVGTDIQSWDTYTRLKDVLMVLGDVDQELRGERVTAALRAGARHEDLIATVNRRVTVRMADRILPNLSLKVRRKYVKELLDVYLSRAPVQHRTGISHLLASTLRLPKLLSTSFSGLSALRSASNCLAPSVIEGCIVGPPCVDLQFLFAIGKVDHAVKHLFEIGVSGPPGYPPRTLLAAVEKLVEDGMNIRLACVGRNANHVDEILGHEPLQGYKLLCIQVFPTPNGRGVNVQVVTASSMTVAMIESWHNNE